jgi:hypothetical protein
MRKIPTIFLRDEQDRRYVTDVVDPRCAWVFTDRGVVGTRKYDGTCVMLDDNGNWWARREIKAGKDIPDDFIESEHDGTTGKTVGWEPIARSSFARWHAEALREADENVEEPGGWKPGTYELIGPKVNGNPEGYEDHWLIRHADAEVCMSGTITVDGVRERVRELHERDGQEGIVFVHPDGRMAKLKGRDFPKE